MSAKMEVLIITGMSGAGKTVAVHSVEDLGYFVIDNMIPSLVSKFINVMEESRQYNKVAMVIDSRARGFYDQLGGTIADLRERHDLHVNVIFLDATDERLVSRYKETRRSHPLSLHGTVLQGIRKERQLMNGLKSRSDVVIDTTTLTPHNLKVRIADYFGEGAGSNFYIEVMSFGFKYGLPLDADVVMDVRFLPNPFYVPALKHLTGNDTAVQEYVMNNPTAQNFYRHFLQLLKSTLPGYIHEGKSSLTIAIGCTGGQHRSVTIANRVATALKKNHYTVNVHHRDIGKAQ